MIVTFSKLWLLVVVFVALLYQDGLRGNGVLGRRYEPISEETEQVDKSCSEEIIDSASKTENRSANDAADSGGTSEGPYSEKSRNFPVQSNRKKKDFDDGAKKVDNGYEDNDSCETTHYDDEDDVKLKANQGVRNKVSINNNRRDKEVTRNKRYKEDEEEVDVSYNEKQSAGKKSIKYKNTANGLHKISNNDDDDIDEGNYKSGVKTTLNQRTSKNENYAKTIQGFDWNKNKHSKRFHSEEDENEYEEKGNSEENNEVDNESKEEEEPKFTIIKGNSKDIALFLNKEVSPFKIDTRKSNNELRKKIERSKKINKSRDVYVYMYNIIKKNPRKNRLKKIQQREALISIVRNILIPLIHKDF